MKESAFQLVVLSPRDKEFVAAMKHIRHTIEKRRRFISFLYMRMIGRI
ncbi:hypothetical protein LCGC14_0629340 [marine sediment metagenome]|uniref:Uncharacterized protein n=1 Tax=marine sediment metagenome TaxID=412755 RepID=A0A0F9R7M4_9ZZZZ